MEPKFPDHLITNLTFFENTYASYLKNPQSVSSSWRHFFEGYEFGSALAGIRSEQPNLSGCADLRIYELIRCFRRYGHLLANINPIALQKKETTYLNLEKMGFSQEELEKSFPSQGFCEEAFAPLSSIIQALSSIYCDRIGFEYMGIDDPDLQEWIQKKIEPTLLIEPSLEDKHLILEKLNQSEVLEQYLHVKYAGQKRFSLEGIETIIPILAELIEEGVKQGLSDFFIGMAHRGRLNVLANILGKPYSVIFREFEDTFYPLSETDGSGDVKYHKGFSSRTKKDVGLHLSPNASHLESVDAIVLGQVRAKQLEKGDDPSCATAFLLHGDAAFAGQGVVYETMQLSRLNGYATGGTIHIILNNQIGFTTLPEEAHSMHYCTDLAKAFNAPVFHLNAEDPESCLFAAKMAIELRQRFHCDVILDLNGYRKYGHNEGDEPSFTQPIHYQFIRSKTSIRNIYFEHLVSEGHAEKEMAESLEKAFRKTLEEAQSQAKKGTEISTHQAFGSSWMLPLQHADFFETIETGVELSTLQYVANKSFEIPQTFHLHPKLRKWVDERKKMMEANIKEPSIDWGMGECLALSSLLLEGTSVRLTGQDVRRGTFSHRHMMWVDQEGGSSYFPLEHLQNGQGTFTLINSPLSEYAALGFEFGYSWEAPDSLVVWEAQYGDFVNTAQVVIDQYISAAEQKWMRSSSLTLLLPHGMEMQGPEHSSGRLERFLQLASQQNMQVANVTSSAQFFHLLRRQVKRPLKKPLIVFTPKSHLRTTFTKSPLEAFTKGSFQEILDDPKHPEEATKLLFCSGRIFFDLDQEREKQKRNDLAILRLEQLYPFHKEKCKALIAKYKKVKHFLWVQEEHKNMGAWESIRSSLEELLPSNQHLSYVGRESSASPATGSPAQHKKELEALLKAAFT